MIIKALMLSGGAAFAALNPVAAVADTGPADSGAYASQAIATGQYAEAEKILQPANFADAVDPARLINIATVYAQTSRLGEARQALMRVQQLPDEQLLLGKGTSYSSHVLAGVMLQRLSRAQ